MGKTTLKFNGRMEELPVLGSTLKHSFERDLTDFQAYSPDFNDGYVANFTTLLAAADELVNPVILRKEIKAITARMYATIDALKPVLTRLEGYVNRAEGLTVQADDFNFKTLRAAINRKNTEGIIAELKTLLRLADANRTALHAKGYAPEMHAELQSRLAAIQSDRTEQNRKMNEREMQVQANIGTLNALWDVIRDVLDTGKRLYKDRNPVKAADYTLTSLKKYVRQDTRSKTEEVVAGE